MPSSQLNLQELLHAYREAHGVEARVWRRSGQGWLLFAGSEVPPLHGPPPGAVRLRDPAGPETWLEMVKASGDNGEVARAFLKLLVEQLLQHQAEGRFFGRELAERYEEITLLYTISEILGSVISLEEAASTILGEVVDTMGVKRAALWIHEPERDSLELVAAVGGEGHSDPIEVADPSSVTAAVFRERRPVIMEPGEAYPREAETATETTVDSFLSIPVSYTPPRGEPRTIGVINLIGRTLEEGFSAGDQKLITAIASQIGAAVENSRLVADSVRQERMGREMELAHDLQLKLLPAAEQFRDRAEIAARCSPADSVGGDFYHLVPLSGGRFGVMIGDVSSHGFAAALIMALTMSAVAIHASEGDPPAVVFRRLHRALIDELETTEMYLTLFYGVIDPVAGEIVYANAGHPHAFRMRPGEAPLRLSPTNPPFGIVDLDDYGEEAVPWAAGKDTLFLFTDGLAESLGQSDGESRLLQLAVSGIARPLDQLIETLFTAAASIDRLPSDDRSAVLVRL